ncbi:MAG: GGDEF domain-containing protein [Armatimonadota bacterium]|nr:GGDEF domain-containing protein [Armatimonadota bacterium]MDW8157214.1 GGDEF domain-containing protein [Armatimonadota bacterium]
MGLAELAVGLPHALALQPGLLALLLVLSGAGNLIAVRFPGDVLFTMQGPVALAGVWLVGWPISLPVNLLSSLVLAASQRATFWRAVLYFGNATTGMVVADGVFRSLTPGPLALAASPAEVAVLLAAGAAFGLSTGLVISVGRFLDTGDRVHLRPGRWCQLAGASVVLYVPLSFLMVTALRAGSGGALLASSVWLLASLAVKGFADTHEANRRLREALKSLEELAVTDPLTGLYNRRRFDEALRWECQRAARSGSPVSLLLVDLRGLKRVNDRLGHQAGDALLRATAHAIRSTIRATDLAFRIGGDEFAVILPDTDSGGAALVAQAMVEEGERAPVRVGHEEVHARLTVGTATCPQDGTTPEQLALAADLAMYRARDAGRAVGQASGPLAAPGSHD